ILLAGVAILLIFATRKRYLEKKAHDAALDHLDRVKRRDYIAPSEEETAPQAAQTPAPAETAAEPVPEDTVFAGDTTEEPLSEEELPHMKYVRNAYQRSGVMDTADEAQGKGKSAYTSDEAYRKPAEPRESEAEYGAAEYREEQEAYREADDYSDDAAGYEEEPYKRPSKADRMTEEEPGTDESREAYSPTEEETADDAALEGEGFEPANGDEWTSYEPEEQAPAEHRTSTRRRRRRTEDQPTDQ
ncbi:MAG: hypothetical protein PHY64_11630, partial [Eubacteriales bacterium]|nr:hypothetical protein [Eubacteriales bacterium]